MTTRSAALAAMCVIVALSPSGPATLSAQATAALVVSEVHPSGSGNGSYSADWFEITNTGEAAADLTGFRVDDNSNSFGSALALRGVASLPPGRSAVFIESNADGSGDAAVLAAFSAAWFGTATPPAGTLIGFYGGSGIGLGTGGDAVNLFDGSGTRITGVSFGAATAGVTFDNATNLGGTTLPLRTVATLSAPFVRSAFRSFDDREVGSPGRRGTVSSVDLSMYVRVGRFDLPEPTRTSAPSGSVLAQEVSAVTYNWHTNTLFVVGDGGTSIVQVSKTGQLIDSMTLAPGGSPQGTEFYDPEGLTYVGGGRFVMIEERDRRAVLFTYAPGTTLTRAAALTVPLGTFVGNVGIEGLTFDPLTNGYVAVKETTPQGIFQTLIDFAAGTASNGSATTANSIDLFDPALAGLADFADVFALSNVAADGAQAGNLLVLSQEAARIVNIDRSGTISSALDIQSDPGNPLPVADQQHEGLTMDSEGVLYVVSENGGGSIDFPQLWVYAPSTVPNQAPTAITLTNQVNSLAENTSTATRLKVADVVIADDGLGVNNLAVSGADSAFFEVDGSGLFVRAGVTLDYETKNAYSVIVEVDDPAAGAAPDASTGYALTLTDVNETPGGESSVAVTEVAAWGSGNSPYGADWFELKNTGTQPINLAGWRMDDSSSAFASAVVLTGVNSIAPGESAIFLETASPSTVIPSFLGTWFGSTPPAGLQVGSYSGPGVGLSTGGDAVSVFDATGTLRASVSFGASPTGPFPSFDNGAALDHTTISQLSVVGVRGAFAAASDAAEIGSPGDRGGPIGVLAITEVAPWSSGNSPVAADWFEITNVGPAPVDVTGWRMDDNSQSPVGAVPLAGIASIAPGESVVFIETNDLPARREAFLNTWFGANRPAALQVGSYTGSGVGLGTAGDQVNVYDPAGVLRATVSFGSAPAAPPFATFDNAAGLDNVTLAQLSVVGVNGAFVAANDSSEIGSPGRIEADFVPPSVIVSEVSPWSSGNAAYRSDWFEVTNTGTTTVTVAGWKFDDSSNLPGSAVPLRGVTAIPAGASAIFLEGTADGSTDAALRASFASAWFGTAAPPEHLQIGFYGGSGVGLSTDGDAVNLFDASGNRLTGVAFGAAVTGATFDNAEGLGGTTLPLPTITRLSVAGQNGAFLAADAAEVGSPGTIAADTSAPVMAQPQDLFVSAVDASGATAVYATPAADDNVDLSVAVSCQPASGALFPLGATAVNCSATDAAGNASTVAFTVTVRDTTPPVLAPLPDVAITTTGAAAVVQFSPAASDNVSAPAAIVVECTPPSGSTFPAGRTAVSCTAFDEAGNASAPAGFTVSVNRMPFANTDNAAVLEGAGVTIDVLTNDVDPDGDALALTHVGAAGHGTTALAESGIRYTPAAAFHGVDSFSYLVSDGRGGVATGTVRVHVSRLGRFVALSRDLTWLRTGASVVSGDVGAVEARSAGHSDSVRDDGDRQDVTVRIGSGVTLRAPTSRVAGDAVVLANRAAVHDVTYNQLMAHRSSVILGSRVTPMAVPFVALPAFPAIAAGTQRVTVPRNQSVTLAPGQYGDVTVANGATLVLQGGLYQFRSLDVGAQAVVMFRGPSELRVQRDLVTRAKARLALDASVAGLDASHVVIYVGGIDQECRTIGADDDGDDAGAVSVHIGSNNLVQANIYAQRGTVWLKSNTHATGAFIGMHVRIGSGTQLTLQSAFR